MFQNQIYQVKCFNLEIFEIFQTCPAHNPLSGIATVAGGYAVRELEDRLLSVRIPLTESTFGASYIALIYCRQNQTRRASFTRASIRSTTKCPAHRTSRSRLRLRSVSQILVQLAPTPTMLLLLEKRSTSVLSDTTTAADHERTMRKKNWGGGQ